MNIETFEADRIIPIDDSDYSAFAKSAVRNATSRVWISQFLGNVYPYHDPELIVRKTLRSIAAAYKRNIDLRVILDKIRGNDGMHSANQLMVLLMQHMGIPVRYYAGRKRSLHAKYWIVDDQLVVMGSHNLTDGALRRHRESSIAVHSPDVNRRFSNHFRREWALAEIERQNLEARRAESQRRSQHTWIVGDV